MEIRFDITIAASTALFNAFKFKGCELFNLNAFIGDTKFYQGLDAEMIWEKIKDMDLHVNVVYYFDVKKVGGGANELVRILILKTPTGLYAVINDRDWDDEGDEYVNCELYFKGSRGSLTQWGFIPLIGSTPTENGMSTSTGDFVECVDTEIFDIEVLYTNGPLNMLWYETEFDYLIRTCSDDLEKRTRFAEKLTDELRALESDRLWDIANGQFDIPGMINHIKAADKLLPGWRETVKQLLEARISLESIFLKA